MRKSQLLFIGLIVAGAAGLYWLLLPKPVLVEATTVTSGQFADAVEEDGQARVRDRYTVSAPVSGRLGRISLKPGDAVEEGQTLTSILPEISPLLAARTRQELEERLGAAEATVGEAGSLVEQAKVLLQQARADLARTQMLAERQFVSAAKLDQDRYAVEAAERAVAAAEKRRDSAEHVLEEARMALSQEIKPDNANAYPVTAPVNGEILKVIEESARFVLVGTPLIELGNPRDLEIAVDVLTTDAARMEPGDPVVIKRWGGPVDLEARLRRIEPSGFSKVSALGVEERRVWVYADITSPPDIWTTLGDGYRVDVEIVVDRIENATLVPVGALFRRGEAWNVFVIADGRAELRTLDVTRISGRVAAIASGVTPGESVIVYPPPSIDDGTKVKTR